MLGSPNPGSSYRDVAIPDQPQGLVTAALCWWDEKPADLEACVRGMANIADRVVALDGAYERFPGATASSPPEQARVIRETAEACGMECLVITPDHPWAGQLEKRTYLYRFAALDTKWVVVVDADHIIKTDRMAVRNELATLSPSVDVIAAPYSVPLNGSVKGASKWHRDNAGKTWDHRLLFRALPNLTVEGRHWWVSAVKDGRKVWVLHSDVGGLGLPGHHLRTPYEVEHRYLFRSRARISAMRTFLADRDKIVKATDQEDAA
jgi:hypothetical protein